MKEQMPKTLECCGKKPKRTAWQLGFRDETNKYTIECRVCKNRVVEDDDSHSDYTIELNAVKKWNELINTTQQGGGR